MPVTIAATIRQRGFRKWYERELIRSHTHLVLLLLCTLAVLGALEALSDGGMQGRLLLAASLAVAGALGAWALRQYLFFLTRAEAVAHQASCPQCRAYARWVIERDEAGDEAADTPATLAVCCRACAQRWTIEI